ncbi:MAG: tRNA (adenosine(37)-N6)-dimethylallyltransferase MiaA [Sediminicola sp.]|tara:strand:- start:162928 stop:164349 length:1422 start_codon:yes stop_codon:yes gene_type:complete
MEKILISVVGPTAIGKTRLAIQLAQHFGTVILSADSRQFYKEMAIGTAVPSTEELRTAQHYFVQHIGIGDDYSVGDYEREALQLLKTLFQKNDLVVMVGGSGLYIDAVTKGLDSFPEVDPKYRTGLNLVLKEEGIVPLQEELSRLDPVHYSNMDVQNPHRLVRALEICLGTGKPYSSFLGKDRKPRDFRTVTVGIQADRKIIYERIDQRVDLMMAEGLLEEVTSLQPYKDQNALQTVGYQELFRYLEGKCSLEFSIAEIKKNSRRFAKRQLTWFKRNKNTLWVAHSAPFTDIIPLIDKEIKHVRTMASTRSIFFVMGVSGSGKSTIGRLLAEALNIPFLDGDDFHPPENVAKMKEGHALNDDDRHGWLLELNRLALKNKEKGAVIACSALKESYRELLQQGLENKEVFIYLEGTYDQIMERLQKRKNHFMPPGLLRSQFDTLSPPVNGITVSIDQTPAEMVQEIKWKLGEVKM